MTRLLLTSLLFLTFLCTSVRAQTEPRTLPVRVTDALRFGQTDVFGSARFFGTGGSMTAIGVDGSTLHTNPAGIGWNRFSAAQITPGFALNNLTARLRNGTGNEDTDETKGTFVVPSANIVWASDTRSINWSTFNFGISYTRLADFNETIEYSGRSEGGIIDAIVEDLNDGIFDDFRAGLAERIPGVIQEDDLGFFSDFDLESSLGGEVRRQGRVERTGSLNEIALGFGGNYMEKVLWGFTIGIPVIDFTETKIYDEIDDQDEITFFDNAGFDELLELSGSGVNFKLGVIGRPTDNIRLSAAVHSPTFWTVDEVYETTFEYNYTDNGVGLGGTELSPRSESTYNLRTPWKFYVGGGYLFRDKGFLSVDLDYSNLAGTSFSFDDFATVDEASNADVDRELKGMLGVRVGGELNLKPFQVRAGVGYRQNPVVNLRNDEDEAFLSLSGGLGYSSGKFFIDGALRLEDVNSYYSPYSTFAFDGQVVDTNRSRITGLVTVGFRGF
ncbi:hypothetical protein FUA23_08105 [Neolewinella aurantiaca]|uniref:Outer membrane protein transport protein (OMPP1/FadL/TodX) n=1 Tax=Neolewinella aurantiaca TaxID=2602767 RepID=A0A5C7FW98_9BACT|nr:hypothetical protein [Neolewinella aurantiaca]TXF89911.1 hypothetical protein FUA23_08105 [Neolewinella aurantiaca]